MATEVIVAIITSVATLVGLILNAILDKRKKAALANSQVTAVEITTPLAQHSFHSNIKEYAREIESSFVVPDEAKNLIYHDLLLNKYEYWTEPVMEFAVETDECFSNCKKNCMECNLLYVRAMEMFRKGMTYETYYRDGHYTLEEQQVLEIVMGKFKQWHADRVERFKNKIQSVCLDSNYYRNCNVKGAVLLDSLDDALFDTIKDAKLTIKELNGELTGLNFRGKVIGS